MRDIACQDLKKVFCGAVQWQRINLKAAGRRAARG
jgi:hypothetical protein